MICHLLREIVIVIARRRAIKKHSSTGFTKPTNSPREAISVQRDVYGPVSHHAPSEMPRMSRYILVAVIES